MESKISEYARHTLCNRKLLKSFDCKLCVVTIKCMCPHAYTCTCLDATPYATICKRVHLVHMETSDYICL